MKTSEIKFIVGLILCLLSAVFMYFDIYAVSGRVALGILGLIFVATSKYRWLDRFYC